MVNKDAKERGHCEELAQELNVCLVDVVAGQKGCVEMDVMSELSDRGVIWPEHLH